MKYDEMYYLDNPSAMDALTEEQQLELIENGFLEIEEESELPVEPTETPPKSEVVEPPPEIESKGGKHTIPYKELEDARLQAEHWRTVAEQRDAMISELQAAKKADEGTGETTQQDAVIEKYETQFPEILDDFKPVIESIIEKRINDALAKVDSRFGAVESTLTAQREQAENDIITSAHPDILQIMDTKEFNDWVADNPNIIDRRTKDAINILKAMTDVNVPSIIEVFNQYKDLHKSTAKETAKADLLNQAKDKISKAKVATPGTFSDIPSGVKRGGNTDIEEFLSKSDAEQERILQGMTPDAIDKLYARL